MSFPPLLPNGFAVVLLAVFVAGPLSAQEADPATPTPAPTIAEPSGSPAKSAPSHVAIPSFPGPAPSVMPPAQITAQAAEPTQEGPRVETMVFIRHGEKPASDQGQLSLQGFNRALALPEVLIARYGPAQYIFAPATTKKSASRGATVAPESTFAYIRPLMTIEPTAIRLGLPVETKFAYDEIGGLQSELAAPAYQRAVVYVAWEHHYLDLLVKRLVSVFGGDAATVPEWPGGDFDSIFVVRVRTEGGRRTATFTHEHEGLDGLSTEFPQFKGR